MRRREVLQGRRRMKFEDVYGRWQQRRLSQAEAAEVLGMSERTFRRWRDLAGLLDRRLGRPWRGMMLHQDGSRHRWAAGAGPGARPDRHHGRCHL